MMLHFILWNSSTSQEERALGASSAAQLPEAPDDCAWIPLAGNINDQTIALVDGVPTEVDRTPLIEVARAFRWAAAKDYRDARQLGGFMTGFGRVQTDQISQSRISAAALAATISQSTGQPFVLNWTLEDNTVVPIGAGDMVTLGFAVLAFVAACQDAGTAIRQAINAAATLEALAAIDITAGYPATATPAD